MSMLKRALLYILRKKGTTVLLLVILIILSSLMLISLSVGKGAEAAAAEMREAFGGYFKVEADFENRELQYPDDAFIDSVMTLDGLTGYNAMDIYYLITSDLTLIPARFTWEADPKARLARFLSNTDTSLHEYFVSHTFDLVEGRHIALQDSGKALVSDTLAQANGLDVGDIVTGAVTTDVASEGQGVGRAFNCQIVGIFHVNDPPEVTFTTPECDVPDNFIFTDTATGRAAISAMAGKDVARYRNGVTFFTNDPSKLQSLASEAQALPGVDWSGRKLTINDQAYRASALPLEKLSGFIALLIAIIIVVSIVLLWLILTMAMRDRVYEMGVYLSMGYSKLAVFAQHLTECLVVALAAFLIAWAVAGAAADAAGNLLLDAMPQEHQVVEQNSPDTAYFNDPVNVDYAQIRAERVDVSVGFLEWISVVGLGGLVIVTSVGLSSIMVVRMKPKEILSQAR